MAFFIGIAGPWIVLMALDLFWTKQGLEGPQAESNQGLQNRLERLLRPREGRPIPLPVRHRPRGTHEAAPGRPLTESPEVGAAA